MGTGRPRRTAEQMIAHMLRNRVVTKAGCWIWKGTKRNSRYKRIMFDRKAISAHRLSFLFLKREFLGENHVLHDCDNPPCFNPAHLHAGTLKMNSQECVLRNRHRNSRKEKCKRGHALAGENLVSTMVYGKMVRQCRTCQINRRKYGRGNHGNNVNHNRHKTA